MRRYLMQLGVGFLMLLCAARTSIAVNVLMLTDSSGTLTTSETTLRSRLQQAGFTVNTLWDADTQANYTAAFSNNDCVYVPSSVLSTDVANKLRSAQIGVINEEVLLMDELGFCTTGGTTTSGNSISIATNAHYITTPFATGLFSLGSSTYTISRAAGTMAAGATVIATVGGVNSILAVEQGATLANTINSNSLALGRRVQMPIECGVVDVNTLSVNAQNLIQRIVWWASGYEGELEGHWKLNETSGTSAADSSGKGRTGTVTGTATWGAAVLNNGFTFNGATRIQATGLMTSPRNVSIAGWANLTTADSAGAEIISLGDHVLLRLDEAGATKAQFYNGSTYVTVSVNRTFAGTGWHHFAAVFDDPHDTFKLYIDGGLVATLTTTSSISYPGLGSNTVIGRHGNAGTTRDFAGTIDDVRVYSYVLGATQVAQLYGLVGRWELDQSSGTNAADSTPFDRSATLSGTPSWSSDCGGMAAFDFNGTSHYFTVPNTADFQPTGMLSFCAWINGDSWGSGTDVDAIVRKGDANPNNFGLAISDGRVELLLDGNDGSGIRGNTVLSTGQWYHVAATWDGATAKLYVNGVLDNSPGTARVGTIATDTRPLYIGGRAGADYFDGMLRDVRIYNRTLTASELIDGASLVGHWQFAEGTGTNSADSSGMSNTASLSGGATWTSDCAGNNNALLTNGTGGIAQTVAAFDPPSVGTVAFWMRSTGATASTARIMGLGGDWEIRQNADGRVISDLSGDGNTTIGTVTPLTEAGRWYHFAATYDVSTKAYTIYVDGHQELSGTNAGAMSKQAPDVLSFGTRTGTTDYWKVRYEMCEFTTASCARWKSPSYMASLGIGSSTKRAAWWPRILQA